MLFAIGVAVAVVATRSPWRSRSHSSFMCISEARWEPSIDGSNTANRTLVTYKETKADAKIDAPSTWTGSWRDPRFSPPSDGGRPENALTGTLWLVQGTNQSMNVPAEAGKLRLHRKIHMPASFKAGTTGVDVFVFEAMAPGQTQVRLEQKRAWESVPVRYETITINVGDR